MFLTNTLEEPHVPTDGQTYLMLNAIAQESASADEVKRDQPVMVILEVWPESHWPGFALLQADVLQSYTA